MSKAKPMRISRRLELLKASGRKHWTHAQFRRYMTKTLHAGAPYWPFPGEETPGGKNRPTPRQRKRATRGGQPRLYDRGQVAALLAGEARG